MSSVGFKNPLKYDAFLKSFSPNWTKLVKLLSYPGNPKIMKNVIKDIQIH